METKGYPKEKLTLKNIRSDLRKKLCKEVLLLMVIAVGFVMMVYCVAKVPAYLFEDSGRGLPGWFYALMYPIVLGTSVLSVWRLCSGLRLKNRIVTDRLISAESGSDISVRTYLKTNYCTLHFARYGDYSVPQKNHTWSKLYPLTCMGEYYHASEGDEYYLVLSKPHNGKILLAYNTKMFTLEDVK